MLLSNQFLELFREETYAVNLALYDDKELMNPFDNILAKDPISGVWTKQYSVVPMGELGGRKEAEPIPQKNMVMGYTCYGAQSIEVSGKLNLSKKLEQRSREFTNGHGVVNEATFAGHLSDSLGRGFLVRRGQKWHKLAARIFNFGGIQAGSPFFNQFVRSEGFSDIPNSPLIYDGRPLFALPANAHPSYAAGALAGPDSAPVGTSIDMAGTIPDTGGYFNAFQFAPAYWALKRVVTHFINNMQYDENDELYYKTPDTLLVSSHDLMKWTEILESKFIEPTQNGNTTNICNVFQLEGFTMTLEHSPFLVKNTWFVGCRNSGGIKLLDVAEKEDPWAYYRDENNRAYYISFEDQWGFLIRNWRSWVAGSISLDGVTPPTLNDIPEENWHIVPTGV